MQAHFKILLFSKNCNFYPVTFYKTSPKFPLLLPSHNCIIIHNVQFSRCNRISLKKFNEISYLYGISVNLLKEVVGQSGLEPPTSRLSVVCSSQLSYWPVRLLLVESTGIEPVTSCLQGRRSPSWANPPGFFFIQDTSYYVPSKLNNASSLKTLCTDLRTLLMKNLLH